MRRWLLLATASCLLFAQAPAALRPGPLNDGSILLPMGWRIRPAGTQLPTGPFPLNSAISPDGKFALVVNSGQPASISVVRTDTLTESSRVPVESAWHGITFSGDGRNVYVGGGARNSVYEFTFSPEGELKLSKEMKAPTAGGFLGDVAIPPAGRLVYAADVLRDQIVVFNPQSGRVIEQFKSGRRPYQILFHPDGKSYYVSSWADASIFNYLTNSGEEVDRVRVAPHPTAMLLSDRKIPDEPAAPALRLFVAAANTNNVFVIGIAASGLMQQSDVLNIGFTPVLPAGMTPSALALSKDQTQLYIACSNVNAIAVADISELDGRLAGFVPAGAYPSSIRALPDNRLVVTNAHSDSLSIVAPPREEALAAMTDQALDLVEYDPTLPNNATFPVENVMLVWYDAPLRGNFSRIAKGFGVALNFFPNAPGSEGFDWVLNGVPSDFVQRMRGNPIAQNDPANLPAAGSLLTNARQAGLTVGEFGPDLPESLPDALPRLTVIRLSGTDADRNLGRIVETLSKSPVWSKTILFLLANNTAPVLVSPYTRTAPDTPGMFFNHSSVARTIELILKLRPMTVFDASARPLTDLFSASANPEPYTAEAP